MAKLKPRKKGSKPGVAALSVPRPEGNLIFAVAGLLCIALLSAGFTAWACDYVVKGFQNSNTMALLITDAGIKSDDKNLERQLSSATSALLMLRDVGLSVVIGGFGVALAVLIRNITKPKS